MANPFIGEIRIFGGNFAPQDWAFCNGQLLAISEFEALFSVIGTTYGGDGQTTFALPDLQGRIPVNAGQGTGTSLRLIGQQFGAETVSLSVDQLPVHTHQLQVNTGVGNSSTPANAFLAAQGGAAIYGAPPPAVSLNALSVATSGGNQPHDNLQPYLAVNFIIALVGIFPNRS